jgi:dephospho-CoA kinase
MLVLGLTGAIASGKSTVAAMFAEMGAAVFDADAAVHALYAGEAVAPIGAAFPGTTKDGTVDREALASKVAADPSALARLEGIVHPMVREAEAAFRAAAASSGRRVIVLDIPLLFETGGEARVDAVVAVTAPADVLSARALRRPGMTAERYAALTARQMSDADKRTRAHFVIDTSGPFAATRKQVADVMRAVAGMAAGV